LTVNKRSSRVSERPADSCTALSIACGPRDRRAGAGAGSSTRDAVVAHRGPAKAIRPCPPVRISKDGQVSQT
jgi:hypothetical protein